MTIFADDDDDTGGVGGNTGVANVAADAGADNDNATHKLLQLV